MRECGVELTHLSGNFDVLVNAARIVPQPGPKQTHGPINLPSTVLYFSAKKKISPRNSIRIEPRRADYFPDFTPHLGGCPLICIDDENPFRLCALDRGVALESDSDEWIRNDCSSGLLCQAHRIVRRSILDDEYLICPADTFNARDNVRRLIPGGNYN